MKQKAKVGLRIVAVFEFISAVTGWVTLLTLLLVFLNTQQVSLLLVAVYLVLTLASGIAGSWLWNYKYAGLVFSLTLQLIQVPIYASQSFPYRPLGFNLTSIWGWNARHGMHVTQQGINWIPLMLFIAILVCFRSWQPEWENSKPNTQDTPKPSIPPVSS